MKRFLLLLLPLIACSQTPQPQLILTAAPGQPVTSISAVAIGPGGTATTLYYWVIARYASGDALRTGPAPAFNTVGVANLNSQSYVFISWSAMPGAIGYDVLRSTTQAWPAPCNACAVAVSTTNVSVNDQGGVLSAYPPGGRQPSTPATATFAINNSGASPFVGMNMTNGLGSNNYRLALISGTIAQGDCVMAATNSILVDAGAACGTGGGGGSTVITSGTGIVVTPSGGPSPYLIAIDTATVPTLGGSNTWTGTNDFTASTVLGLTASPATVLVTPASDILQASVINTTPTAFATTFAINSNALVTGKSYKVTYNLAVTSSGTPVDYQFQLNLQKAGPTNVICYYQATPATPTAGPTTVYTAISFVISATAAAGAAAPTITGLTTPPSSANTSLLTYRNFVVQPINVDTTAIQTVQLRLIYSGNTAGNSVQLLSMLAEPLG